MSRALVWKTDSRTSELGPRALIGCVGQRVIYRLIPLKDDWWQIDFRLPGACTGRMDGDVVEWCEAHFKEWITRFTADLAQQWEGAPHG